MAKIDISKERPLTLQKLSQIVKEERSVSRAYCTYWTWVNDGLERKSDGQKVYLDHIYIGGTLCSSLEAYDRFIEKLNGEDE